MQGAADFALKDFGKRRDGAARFVERDAFDAAHGEKQRGQADALAFGAKVSGCTIHFVDSSVDAGPVILQKAVPVLDDDTPDTLAARILEQEHIFLPLAVRLFAEGRLQVEGRRVWIDTRGIELPTGA